MPNNGLTGAVPFATADPEAKQHIQESAEAMFEAREKAFRHASDLYTMNPCGKNWRKLVLAHAGYQVAFRCEHGNPEADT